MICLPISQSPIEIDKLVGLWAVNVITYLGNKCNLDFAYLKYDWG